MEVGSKITSIFVTLIFVTSTAPSFSSAASATVSSPTNIFQSQIMIGAAAQNQSDNAVWLSGWSYRLPIAITNPPQALQDYPLQITLDTETMILNEKLNDDAGDLRFALADGTVLPYWIESGINTTSTIIWVRVHSIPLEGTTIYAYYGNADASSAENEEAALYSSSTWILNDDFSGTEIDTNKWNVTGSNPTIVGNALRINGSGGWTSQGVNSILTLDRGAASYVIEYSQMTTNSDITGGIMSGYGPYPLNITPGVMHYWAGASPWFKYVDGAASAIAGRSANTWYKMEIKLKANAGYTLLANGKTLLHHWIEKYDSENAEAWVKVPSIPASGSATIYLYYGKRSAYSTENGDAIFIFFDDFKTIDTTKWRQSWAVSDGVAAQGQRNSDLVSVENWPFDNVIVKARVRTSDAAPGEEIFHDFGLVQNSDGTYSVEVEQGMSLLSQNEWCNAIDNVKDNQFIKNPNQYMNALKNKFDAVFTMVHENNYVEAADKLANDILKKLDADEKADWTKEPLFVEEITALISMLRKGVSVV